MDTNPSFDSESFSPIEWINKTFSDNPSDKKNEENNENLPDNIEVKIADLQLLALELNTGLDGICTQAILTIPALLKKVNLLHGECESVRSHVLRLKMKLAAYSDQGNINAVLKALDTVKERMVAAQAALQQAGNITSTVIMIEELLGNKNYLETVNELLAIKTSLSAIGTGVFKTNPELKKTHDHFLLLAEKVKEKLLENFVEALDTENIPVIAETSSLLCKLDLTQEEIAEQYSSHCVLSLLRRTPKLHYEFLYEFIASNIKKKNKVILKAFPEFDHDTFLFILCTKVFTEFQENIRDSIPDIEKSFCDITLIPNLIKHLHECFQKIAPLFQNTSSNYSNKFLIHLAKLAGGPFQSILRSYPDVEKEYLNDRLRFDTIPSFHQKQKIGTSASSITNNQRQELNLFIHKLHELETNVFKEILASYQRVLDFTMGLGTPRWIEELEKGVLKTFLSICFNMLKDIRSNTTDRITPAPIDNESPTFQWVLFETAAQLLKIAFSLHNKLNLFIHTVKTNNQTITKRLESPDTTFSISDLNWYCYFVAYFSYFSGKPDTPLKTPPQDRDVSELLAKTSFSVVPDLFSKTLPQYQAFLSATQTYFFDTIFDHLKRCLHRLPSEYNALSVQLSSEQPAGPVFTSPMAYITRVGDFLLTLPQQLEPFSDDKAFGYVPKISLEYPNLKKYFNYQSNSQEIFLDDDDIGAGYASEWIKLVTRNTTFLFLDHIFGLKSLTISQTSQVESDLVYFSNILLALGISPLPLFVNFLHAIRLSESECLHLLQSNEHDVLFSDICALRNFS